MIKKLAIITGLAVMPAFLGVSTVATAGNTTEITERAVKKNHKVVLYGASWCSACHSVKNKLNSLGVKFTYIDVDKSGHKFPYIPVLKVDGKSYVGNLSVAELKRILS